MIQNYELGYVRDFSESENFYTLSLDEAMTFDSRIKAMLIADTQFGDCVFELAAVRNELVDSSVNALADGLPKNGLRELWSWVFMRVSFIFSLIAVLVFVIYVCLMLIAFSWPVCKPLIDWICGRM